MRAWVLLFLVGCSAASSAESEGVAPSDVAGEAETDGQANAAANGGGDQAAAGAPADPSACPSEVTVTASASGEQALVVEATSIADTQWGEKGNEAIVLAVTKSDGALVGHLVLHQGKTPFTYGMHAGNLAAGETLVIRQDTDRSAKGAAPGFCVASAKLTATPSEAVGHAPIMKWPREKSFDDLPVLVGWSKRGKSYQIAYTNENGGTVALCGGGAKGLRSEIARWGRALDMEGAYSYGAGPKFERCTGTAAPRMEADHPILYYGDGHNRLFESRGGYGQACGTGGDARADGDLEGWNANNPGNDAAKDDPFTIVLRPLPVELDTVPGRESIVDRYAPWLYRLTWSEVEREGRVDDQQVFPLERYLFVDVYAKDVNGHGDATCGPFFNIQGVDGGFVLRAMTKDGVVSNGPQMTADFMSGTLKRIAIPLAAGVEAADVTKLVFDAYDDDGIYWLAIGDAFVVHPDGRNGAKLEYVNKAKRAVGVYVDDGKSGCTGGTNTKDGVAYPCVGSSHSLTL